MNHIMMVIVDFLSVFGLSNAELPPRAAGARWTKYEPNQQVQNVAVSSRVLDAARTKPPQIEWPQDDIREFANHHSLPSPKWRYPIGTEENGRKIGNTCERDWQYPVFQDYQLKHQPGRTKDLLDKKPQPQKPLFIDYDEKKTATKKWKYPLEQDYIDAREKKNLQKRHMNIPTTFENGEKIGCQDSADVRQCQHTKMLHHLGRFTVSVRGYNNGQPGKRGLQDIAEATTHTADQAPRRPQVEHQGWKKHMKAGRSFTFDLVGHDPYVMQALKVASDQDREEREWADSYIEHKPSTRVSLRLPRGGEKASILKEKP